MQKFSFILTTFRFYRCWVNITFIWSIYSAFFTPLEFGFFEGLPRHMEVLDCIQLVFFADVIIQFFVAYRDDHTYKMVYDRKSIALRWALELVSHLHLRYCLHSFFAFQGIFFIAYVILNSITWMWISWDKIAMLL